MTNSIVFQNQTFVPVGVDAGLAVCDGEAALRVIKPEVAGVEGRFYVDDYTFRDLTPSSPSGNQA